MKAGLMKSHSLAEIEAGFMLEKNARDYF